MRLATASGGPAAVALAGMALAVALAWALFGGGAPGRASAADDGCTVRGTVLDYDSRPVPGIHVRLFRGGELLNTATDEQGGYEFPAARGIIDARFRSSATRMSVELLTEEYAHSPGRFRVFSGRLIGALRTDAFTADDEAGCVRDFNVAAIPSSYIAVRPALERWPDIIEIYQRTRQAWALADALGVEIDYGLPLGVYAWCQEERLGCFAGADGEPAAFSGFASSKSDGSYVTDRPFIVFGPATSGLDDGGRPDNREYHEFGHFFNAALFGDALPLHPDNVPHGGYYRNPSSADSWVEGFAEFYAVMVAKHVDGDRAPERYRLYGAEYDLEIDHLPWEWAGWWEELTLAGLLLDFEDGDGDYWARAASGELRVDGSRVRDIEGGAVVTGQVTNVSGATLDGAEVAVELLDAGGRALYLAAGPVMPSTLRAGERGSFMIPLPPGVTYDAVRVTAGPLAFADDDPIDVTLEELLEAIATFSGRAEYGNGFVFDVAELYEALSAAFGGRDRDRDGVDDVDQVFRAHGFFGDRNGSRSFEAGERLGLTSHPAAGPYPAALPRRDLTPPAEALVTIDSGGVATDAVVYISYPPPHSSRSYGYVAKLDALGRVQITAPPRGYGATVTVIVLADGFEPAIAGRMTSDELWDRWEANPGESSISLTVTMRLDSGEDGEGDGAAAVEGSDAGSSGPPGWVLALGALAAAAALGGYAVILRLYFARR